MSDSDQPQPAPKRKPTSQELRKLREDLERLRKVVEDDRTARYQVEEDEKSKPARFTPPEVRAKILGQAERAEAHDRLHELHYLAAGKPAPSRDED